jgi:hypothetical protein
MGRESDMSVKSKRILFWVAAAGALLLASCGGSEAPVAIEEQVPTPLPTTAPVSPEEDMATPQATPTSIGECEAPAVEITRGSPVSSETVNDDQPPPEHEYFCVEVPEGASSITFELTGTTADLNLYIGYPDLKTVQEGGFTFWYSDERGAVDKVVVVEPGVTEFVEPGPYYIEVSAEDFQASSPFTLTVTVP